ncbi:hypothetical protein HZC53_02830 [Candidatus Uhrbacteria bacterium]|nr:hypothetical protein [Candidatus Uhrbacteria bacterium]
MSRDSLIAKLAKIIGTTSAVFALAVLLVVVRLNSLAETTVTSELQTTADNSAPVIDSLVVSDQENGSLIAEFIPNEGTTKDLYVYGTASDDNGCSDITLITVWVFHAPTMPEGPRPTDNNDTYHVDATISGCTGAGDNGLNYQAIIPIANYVDPTDAGSPYPTETWTAIVLINDDTRDGMSLQNFEINSLAAFDTDSFITYGVLDLGEISTEQTINFTNTGNHRVNAIILATSTRSGDMVSNLPGFSDIPAGNVHFSLTSDSYDRGIPVSGISPYYLNINLPEQTDDLSPAPQVATYWRIKIPDTGVSGTYTNSLDFIAVSY